VSPPERVKAALGRSESGEASAIKGKPVMLAGTCPQASDVEQGI
jgi:hypothetical protein